jgi:hypothetical protein
MGFSPEEYASMAGKESLFNFFKIYLAAPIIALSFAGL